jgi:DNA-binding transcriptional ArsR family regulator
MSDTPAADSILHCEECISPAEAFAVVGNETRLAILEALWRTERPVAFSTLRREVGMRDSAQFNYHLSQLTGQFVKKTEDGYDFRHAGEAVIRAVLSGTLNEDPRIAPFPVEGSCVDCGAGLEARYEDETITISCADCGRTHGTYGFPPGGLDDRTREEVMAAFNQRARHLSCLCADGVCPECNGRMVTTIDRAEDFPDLSVRVHYECQRCRHHVTCSVGLALLDNAEVVSFYRDHGIDLNAVPFWTLEWAISDNHTEVLSADPWELLVTVPVEDERLLVTLDADLRVVESERQECPATDAERAPEAP